MAKLSRDVLKGLVKECLVEILSEGLSGDGNGSSSAGLVNESIAPKKKRPKRRHPTDMISMNSNQDRAKSKAAAMENRINHLAGGNDVMADIFRDTAQRTLPSMAAAEKNIASAGMMERVTRGDQATRAMAANDPMEIFEGASNWADLAFSGKRKDG